MSKRDETRERILDAALALFRERGFDGTTMRDVADAAGLSAGAAYYHFASKEALVLAYYARQMDEHEAAVAATSEGDLRARLAAVFHTKLDLVKGDRRLLGALLRTVGSPESDASVFGPATRDVRERSVALFERALDESPERHLVAVAFWALLLGVLVYFIHDDSPGARRTRALVDDALDLTVPVASMAALPLAAPLLRRLGDALARAGLVTPGSPKPPRARASARSRGRP